MAGTRLQIVSSFLLFILIIAPFAWRLMRVQRADIPHDAIVALSEEWIRLTSAKKVASVWQPQTISLWYSSVDDHATDKESHVYISTKSSMTAFRWKYQINDNQYMESSMTSFHIFFLCNKQENMYEIMVGTARHAWTWACSMKESPGLLQAIERLITKHIKVDEELALAQQDPHIAKLAHRYRLDFTLIKQDGEDPCHWNFPQLVARYLDPILGRLAALAEFTIEQHVVSYASILKGVTPVFDGHNHILHPEDLTNFKSSNEFLTSSVLEDREQKLHFMAVLPSEKQHPLVIKEKNDPKASFARSFEIPGWGGVVILNRDHILQRNRNDEEREFQRMIALFITNLRHLMGFPSFYHRQQEEYRFAETTNEAITLQFLPATHTAICTWEMDRAMRRLLIRHTSGAIVTLHSISVLLNEMTQMTVSQRIHELVSESIQELKTVLSDGTELEIAVVLKHARKASDLADTAYYDPSLIRQLYFPHDQLFGVYAPLLAPLFLPIVFGFIRELKRYKEKQRTRSGTLRKSH